MPYSDLAKKQLWKDNNRERLRDYGRRYRAERPHAVALTRRKYTAKQFGLTLEQHDEMLCSQDGRCAICKKRSKQALSVDHNHDTGRVRGLLCLKCNTMLGMAGDNKRLLSAGVAYLEKDEDPTGGGTPAGGDW